VPSKFLDAFFVLTNVSNFLSTGILNSLIFSRRIYIFLGLFMHVSTLSLFAESTVFLIWVVNAENGNIVLLSQISISNCCWFQLLYSGAWGLRTATGRGQASSSWRAVL
jgi:hypothetical protein